MFDENIFGNPDIYVELNSEAQKRGCIDVSAPALTWHMAFLIPNFARGAYLSKYLDDVAGQIISALFKKGYLSAKAVPGSSFPVQPYLDGRMMFFGRLLAYDADLEALVDVTHRGTEREIRFLPSDERALIFTFDLRLEPRRAALAGGDHDFGKKKITVIVKKFVNMFTITVCAENNWSMDGALDVAFFKRHTISFWDAFSEFLFGLGPEIKHAFASSVFRHVFADLRGIVADRSVLPDMRPFEPAPGDSEPRWADDNDLAERLSALVSGGNRHESTATYLLDGRALLLTALGPQDLSYPAQKRLPLTYLLCVQSGCPSSAPSGSASRMGPAQLGRLVDRLHIVAMMRHAALLDLPQLWEASVRLAKIDTFMRKVRTVVENLDSRGHLTDSDKKRIAAARGRVNAIASCFLTDPRNVARAGLTLRIENSRYYVSQFHAHLPALRMKRVEGYRRYDEFVQRRLGATFEFISRLGVRYERATAVLAAADQSLATALARKAGEELREIQRYGELVLFLVLVPYYLLAGLHYFMALETTYEKLIAITVFLALAQYAFSRFFSSHVWNKRKATIVIFVAWLAAVGTILAEKVIPKEVLQTLIGLAAILNYAGLLLLPSWRRAAGDDAEASIDGRVSRRTIAIRVALIATASTAVAAAILFGGSSR